MEATETTGFMAMTDSIRLLGEIGADLLWGGVGSDWFVLKRVA